MALIFRQVFDPQSSTYSYLLGCSNTRQAVLIDPVLEQTGRDAALIRELGLTLIATLDTHVHADHITGAAVLRRRLASKVMISAVSGASGADRPLKHGDTIGFGEYRLEARATPGHTAGCMSYVLGDETMAFTGDALLIRGSGRTDFQSGDAEALYRSVRLQLFTLPDSCLIYPAHDYRGLTVSSVGEEKRFNPRLGESVSERDFAGYMSNLNLPHPKKIEAAVPANLRCGEPDAISMAHSDSDWAPLIFTFAGIWEIAPDWVDENLDRVQILDVREADEFVGPLGHIRGAIPIPLGQLESRVDQLEKNRPVVAVCRSGARSAQATVLLQRAGFNKVANLNGGMLRWRAEGHRVAEVKR
jgi:sulfur dioxygenase